VRSPSFLSNAWFKRRSAENQTALCVGKTCRCSFEFVSRLRAGPSIARGLGEAFDVVCDRLGPMEADLISSGPLVDEHDGAERQWYSLRHWSNGKATSTSPIPIDESTVMDSEYRHLSRVRYLGEIGIIAHVSERRNIWEDHIADIDAFLTTAAALLEVDLTYRKLLENLPYDLLSHLPKWELFQTEAERRMARLDFDNAPATFMAIRIENLSTIPVEQLKAVMTQISERLKMTVRPTDLIGQLDSQTFLIMLDGADRFAAAERAEDLCSRRDYATPLASTLALKIGLVTREAHSVDTLETFLERACLALYKTASSRSCWSFFHENA